MAQKAVRGTKRRPRRTDLVTALAAQGVVVRLPEIRKYLAAHRDLARILPRICRQARREFSSDAELILAVYRDPEINDRHLTLYVRLSAYDRDTITARLDRVTQPFEGELCKASGFLLVTTDFRVPGSPHGV